MRVESYQEDDMRKAMAKVREELGQDAVIISSRRVAGRTEIMAASDYDPEQLESEIKKLSARRSVGRFEEQAGLGKQQLAAEPPKKLKQQGSGARTKDSDQVWQMMTDENAKAETKMPSLLDMQDELGRLRKLFEGELAQLAWRDVGKSQPNRLALLTRLEMVGISRDIGRKIVEKVLPCNDLETAWQKALRILNRAIKTSKHDVLTDGGVIAMLGATGVGKTTTAAKIAAQFALRHGRKHVAFITTDSSRIGGQEQLISLGSILGVPVQVVNSSHEMQKTLESFSERKLVIIDTAGVSQRDADLLEQFESLKNNNIKIHPHLVLSATAQESVINETIKAFSGIELSAAIITKTDESGSIGAVLSGLIRNRLPAAFIGNGQGIPEDLMPADTNVFIQQVIQSFTESSEQEEKLKRRATRKKVINA